jgi:hypothetical protein
MTSTPAFRSNALVSGFGLGDHDARLQGHRGVACGESAPREGCATQVTGREPGRRMFIEFP